MKCTNRTSYKRKKNNYTHLYVLIVLCMLLLISVCAGGFFYYQYHLKSQPSYALNYETEHYTKSMYKGDLFAADLCIASTDIGIDGFAGDASLKAAGLFSVSQNEVLYADRLFQEIYPASTTKLLTAYLTLKYGNLDDIVTVSANATTFEPEAQLCGLAAGDQISMYDLLCGLLLYSGNDNAVAIAEHISGSTEAFCELMNNEAWALGATHTNFQNPHGLHSEGHYTTAYDLYLIFNACIKDQRFLDIIAMKSYTGTITGADGTVRTAEWTPTNYYSARLTAMPQNMTVIGGKTGTTDEAGSCVILYDQDAQGNPYISVVMGAPDKETLYRDTTQLLEAGVALQTQ